MKWLTKQPDESVIIKPFLWDRESFNKITQEPTIKVIICDVETTGLEVDSSEIIELAYIAIHVIVQTGEVVKIVKEFDQFQDSSQPLSSKIISLTGITQEMIKDKKINWQEVADDFASAEFIVSYNAKFDRPFIEKYLPNSSNNWLCALTQIPWEEWGFTILKQEIIALNHGFYYSAHRAIVDCQVLLTLLQQKQKERYYLSFLMESLSKVSYLIIALKTHISKKQFFNDHNFQWNKPLSVWHKYFNESEKTEAEEVFEKMKNQVYDNIAFNGLMQEISSLNKFRSIDKLVTLTSEAPGKYTKPFMLVGLNIEHSSEITESLKRRLYSYDLYKNKKEWILYLSAEETNKEMEWLTQNVYKSHFKGIVVKNSTYKKPSQ